MMSKSRRWRWAVRAALLLAALLYLRDPAWLIHLDSGFFGWERNRAGQRLRWMGSRGSFFVPSEAKSVTIPLKALFITDDRSPFVIRVFVNDRPTTEVTLPDEQWRSVAFKLLPPKGWPRRVARIDLRSNRTWSERAISVQVGEVTVER